MKDRNLWPKPGRDDCMAKMAGDDYCTGTETSRAYRNGMTYTFCPRHMEQWRASEQVEA